MVLLPGLRGLAAFKDKEKMVFWANVFEELPKEAVGSAIGGNWTLDVILCQSGRKLKNVLISRDTLVRTRIILWSNIKIWGYRENKALVYNYREYRAQSSFLPA